MQQKTYKGELIIDEENGTIWFNSNVTGQCLLRMQGLPIPIPDPEPGGRISNDMLDIRITDSKMVTPTLGQSKQVVIFSWKK